MTSSETVRDAFHYLYPDELPFLKSLVQSLDAPNPIVINIGAGAGTSGLAILESRDDAILVTIDIQDESSPLGCLVAERNVVRDAGLGEAYLKRWYQILARSQDVARGWGRDLFGNGNDTFMVMGKVDMVFVDGDHTYLGCLEDVTRWLPHIRSGGIIAVHDYNKQMLLPNPDGPHPQPWVDVNTVVDNLLMGKLAMIGCIDSLVAFAVP